MKTKTYNSALGLMTVFMLTSTAFASQTSNSDNFSGLYTGMGIGLNSLVSGTTSISTYDTNSIAPVYTKSYIKSKDKASSFIGSLDIGYNYPLQENYNLGLSAFLNLAQHQIRNKFYYIQNTPSITEKTIKLTTEISPLLGGVDLEPGYAIAAHTLFNGIIGWSLQREKI